MNIFSKLPPQYIDSIERLSDALCEACPADEHLQGDEPIIIYNTDTMVYQKIKSMKWEDGQLFITCASSEAP